MANPNVSYKYSNKTKNTKAQCKIVVYRWDKDISIDGELSDEELSKSSRLDISSQVLNCTYNKPMDQIAGSFQFSLTNSPGIIQGNSSYDWKDIIKKGCWCVIYMSNDGNLRMNPKVGPPSPKKKSEAKYIRCIGYIQRVAPKLGMNDNGSHEITFSVSGQDFGVVYEKNTVWHNFFRYEESLIQNVSGTKLNITGNVTLTEAMDLVHDIFYYPLNIPGAKVNSKKSLIEIGLQWLMPQELIQDLNYDLNSVSAGPYWGSLPGVKNFQETLARVAVSDPMAFLSGSSIEQLRKLSVPEFHELFTELDENGKPRLNYRMIPFGINKDLYPTIAGVPGFTLYKDIPSILIPGLDIYGADVAEDEHNRYNSFFAAVTTSLINATDSTNLLISQNYPRQDLNSIRRHGFSPMHTEVDTLVKNEELGNGKADQKLMIEFNEFQRDIWSNNIYAESGTIEKIGSNDVKLGICCRFDKDMPYLVGKRFYIEGYSDDFAVDGNGGATWTQEVSLTRGFEEEDLRNKKGFGSRNVSFKTPDEYTPANVSKGGK